MTGPVVALHQPNYLPWIGWFAKAAAEDVFVLLDDVQFTKGGYTNRVRVKAAGGTALLTVPVRGRDHRRRIDSLEIADDARWARRHALTLEQSYGRSPGWERFGPPVLEALSSGETLLAALNERLARLVLEAFAVTTRVVRASSLGEREGRASESLVDLCRRLGAGTYLSGAGGRKYNDPELFAAAGIALRYSEFTHPVYAQPHGDFVPGLSAVDLLFSAPDDAPRLLRESWRPSRRQSPNGRTPEPPRLPSH